MYLHLLNMWMECKQTSVRFLFFSYTSPLWSSSCPVHPKMHELTKCKWSLWQAWLMLPSIPIDCCRGAKAPDCISKVTAKWALSGRERCALLLIQSYHHDFHNKSSILLFSGFTRQCLKRFNRTPFDTLYEESYFQKTIQSSISWFYFRITAILI